MESMGTDARVGNRSAIQRGGAAALGICGGAPVVLLLALSDCGLVQVHGQFNGKPESASAAPPSAPAAPVASAPQATPAHPHRTSAASNPSAMPQALGSRDDEEVVIEPMPAAVAQAKLQTWKGRAQLSGIALGMRREEVIAACSWVNEGTIKESHVFPPLGDNPAPGAAQSAALSTRYLKSISCGNLEKLTRATFAPPPSASVVLAVGRAIQDLAVTQQFGSSAALVAQLKAAYGQPSQHVTEKFNGVEAEHYAWIFKQHPDEISCAVARAPRGGGGKALVAGIPAGGPCATHVLARIFGQPLLSDARLVLMNPEQFAAANDAHFRLLNRAGAGLPEGAFYADLAKATQAAGLETREMLAQRKRDEADAAVQAKATAAVVTALGKAGGAAASNAPPTNNSSNGAETPYARAERQSRCVDGCYASGCQYGEDSMACSSRQYSEVESCRSRCRQ